MLYNEAQWQCCTCLKLIHTFLTCLILVLTFITHDYPCDVVLESHNYCIIVKNVWTIVAKFKWYRLDIIHQVDI